MEQIGVVDNVKLCKYIRNMKNVFENEELEMPNLVISVVGANGRVEQVVSNNVSYGTYSIGSIVKYDTNLKSVSLLDRNLTADELRDVNLIIAYYQRLKNGSSKNKFNFLKKIDVSFRLGCILTEIREYLAKYNNVGNVKGRSR